jgi:drug/metabolite transporter superfamily protein YnfA
MRSSVLAILVFLLAALLEVAGDAVIRKGLRGGGAAVVLMGCAMLGTYGVVVNLLRWDFSRLLGVYVAVFATIAVVVGRLAFHEAVPASTWAGLAVVVVGGLIIQLGPSFVK